jgi:YD repeat-containing protein
VVLPNGTSFDFVISNIDVITYQVSNGRKVKILCDYNTGNINSFTVIDEDGVKYTFGGSDTQHSLLPGPFNGRYVSWQLTRIDLPNATGPILFSYDHTIESIRVCPEAEIAISHERHPLGDVPHDVQARNLTTESPYSYKMKLLSSISYGNTLITFVYRDQNQNVWYNYVDKIQIQKASTLIKEISLDKTVSSLHGNCGTGFFLAKLDSVTIKSPYAPVDPEVYQCQYHSVSSFSGTDHWGYLNTRNSQYDVANFNIFLEFDPSYYSVYSGASVSPVTKSSQDLNPYYKIKLSRYNSDNRQPAYPESHGVLTRLIYPTGGFTDFIFENHQFLTSTDDNGNYIYNRSNRRKVSAAGFRIRQIINYATDGIVSNTLNFRYGNHLSSNDHDGVGIAVVDPNMLTYMNYSYDHSSGSFPTSVKNMLLGLDPSGNQTSFSNPFMDFIFQSHSWKWQCTFSALNFRRIVNGRSPVVYGEVSVYYGDVNDNTGKTVYRYNVTETGVDLLGRQVNDLFFEEPAYFHNAINYVPKSHQYNQLKDKSDYAFGYSLVKKEAYTWEVRTQQSLAYTGTNPYPPNGGPSYQYVSAHVTPIPVITGSSLLESKTTTTYDPGGKTIVLAESFSYNLDYQVTKIRSTTSDSKVVEKEFVYPGTVEGGTLSAIKQKLVDKNILTPILKATTKLNGNLVSGSQVEYNEFLVNTATLLLPQKTLELEIKSTGNVYVLKDQINTYTVNGNPLEFLSSNGIRSSFIWDSSDKHLLIRADNISHAALSTIVTNSFPSGVTTIPTGPGSNWLTFNSNLRANLPEDVMVTTYTYSLLGNVTSITDPNNVTTYFSYDGFGRLKTVKDNDGNIQRHTDYHLKK